MPELEAATLARPDAELVTVVIGGDIQQIAQVVTARGLSAPVLLDVPGADAAALLRQRYGIESVPWTLVVDGRGRGRQVIVGGQNREFFGKALDALTDSSD